MELLDKEVFVYELISIPLGRPNTNKKYMEISNISGNKNNKTWLQRLKDESWEAELLISTVAIIGTVQLYKFIDWLTIYFIDGYSPNLYLVVYFILFFALIATSILTTMFVLHFLLRAYWVGLVGLNSVFPDYSLEDSAYSEIFTNKMLALLPKLEDTIKEVDDLCSVIFSAAFMIFGMYTYFGLIGILLLTIYNVTKDFVPSWVWWILLGIVCILYVALIIVMGIANLKKNKENNKIQNLYFLVSKWSGYMLMGPMFRYMYQIVMTFMTNFKKKKSLFYLVIIFIVVGAIVGSIQMQNSKIPFLITEGLDYDNPEKFSSYHLSPFSYVNTTKQDEYLFSPQIEADVIERNVFKVFIPLLSYEASIADRTLGEYESEGSRLDPEERKKSRKWYWERYNKYHEIQLNGKPLTVELSRSEKAETGQQGLLGYVNMQGVGQEKNILSITKKLGDFEKRWEIPFRYIEPK